ncbi:Mov34/MPN/PAD-1 family protein [Anoxynatronum buryatiense]|uniref:Integrative and conjugative element protein, VC0181 family n=1 Tax=Anoxynatronum buryatiense TaxID=489973 RepID=A0AA45WZB1_9CLOT|nr:Mov34/MPN/PAD-1 family protein [Anoxynatronum buryatiense]SMP72650.1 integrative and conjugative element protein, VC0181 family [Anoxynatronum buryatiense]
MDITTNTDKVAIKITHNVIERIIKYVRLSNQDCEAGGILIGRESVNEDYIIIEYATEPYPSDIRKKFKFIRKDKNHVLSYKRYYEKYNGIYAYIGEWHTHPESIPHYSQLDLSNWNRISCLNKEEDKSYFHLIIGTKSMRLWEHHHKFEVPKLWLDKVMIT